MFSSTDFMRLVFHANLLARFPAAGAPFRHHLFLHVYLLHGPVRKLGLHPSLLVAKPRIQLFRF